MPLGLASLRHRNRRPLSASSGRLTLRRGRMPLALMHATLNLGTSPVKLAKRAAVVAGTLVMVTANAQPLERWLLPDPDEMVKASNALCLDQAKSTLVAATLRDQGRSKSDVLALVPEAPKALSLRVVSAMRESVEDAFDFPSLSKYSHYSFRSEVCFRETLGGLRMPRLATVLPRIEQCQQVHGPEKSNALFQCIRAVVRNAEPQL